MELFEIIICVLAGLGAGLGTGFAGMSAAAVISPMLITFLGMGTYEAIGIALASDVLASAVSAITYGKNKNIDIKNSIPMFISVLAATVFGAWVSQQVPATTMGSATVFVTLIMGCNLLIKSFSKKEDSSPLHLEGMTRTIASIMCGIIIGFICGFVGAGGGIMMLLLLTKVLNYPLKTAVGTSVFIMSFTALFGATSHFVLDSTVPNIAVLSICIISTLIFALIGANIANKVKPNILNRVTGTVLAVLGVFMVIVTFT